MLWIATKKFTCHLKKGWLGAKFLPFLLHSCNSKCAAALGFAMRLLGAGCWAVQAHLWGSLLRCYFVRLPQNLYFHPGNPQKNHISSSFSLANQKLANKTHRMSPPYLSICSKTA